LLLPHLLLRSLERFLLVVEIRESETDLGGRCIIIVIIILHAGDGIDSCYENILTAIFGIAFRN